MIFYELSGYVVFNPLCDVYDGPYINGAWPGQRQSERAISGERCDARHAFEVVMFIFCLRLLQFMISKFNFRWLLQGHCKHRCFSISLGLSPAFQSFITVGLLFRFVFFIWQGSFSGHKVECELKIRMPKLGS